MLSGTIANEIVVKTSKTGKKFTRNQIKVPRENTTNQFDFIDFVCFGQNAMMLENTVRGAMIEISGELATDTYQKVNRPV